ncbi:CIC11C00000001761 [Sungouiella intermedia]|uniref:CIC11C00000001761 n=1 Tax=Sungouiella intermedia TaxID=45354 RepID=A0A1L0BIF3_9ASCO|nr:CIC11C00000001761 [[Candida] intermedia]
MAQVASLSSTSGVSSLSASGASSRPSVQKKGNVASFTSNLTAVDTYGNEFQAPDYTIKDILSAIPSECYQRRAAESLYYVARDIVCMVAIGYVGNTYIPELPNAYLRFAAWATYSIVQGLFGTGLWVLAHECGHQAFSDYGWLNDLVGWVLHSYWLVPYFSWKFSHGKHHKATGHMERDMVFVPKKREQFIKGRNAHTLEEIASDSPIFSLYTILVQQLGGWIAYLFVNVTGQPVAKTGWGMSHFNPSSAIFEARDYWYIVLSDLGLLIQGFVLYTWYKNYGGFNLLVNWVIPYIGVNHWLVFITFLQHLDPKMPHYEASEWNFARGAAATIDREFGFIGKHIFHDIIETHVLHHYCSRIPFYNARPASEAIKKVMGKHYQHSDENMWVSLWKSARWCQFVEGDNGLLMYRNINGNGVAPKKTA